jgi:hypothetical protein
MESQPFFIELVMNDAGFENDTIYHGKIEICKNSYLQIF